MCAANIITYGLNTTLHLLLLQTKPASKQSNASSNSYTMIRARHSSLDGLDPIRGNAFCMCRLGEAYSEDRGSKYLQNVGRFQPVYKMSHPSKLRVLVIRQRAYTSHSLRDLWFSRRWVLGWRASGPWRNFSVRLTGYTESHFRRSLFSTRYQHDFCNVRWGKRPLSILSTFHLTCTMYSFLTACPVWSWLVQHCYRYQMTN